MKPGIILSIQPTPDGPFDNSRSVGAFCAAAKLYGVVAIKVTDKWLILARELWSDAIIGIAKAHPETVGAAITETHLDAQYLFDIGADYVATSELGVLESANRVGHRGLIFEADCFEQAVQAAKFAPSFISTTMCGYTERTKDAGKGPAIEFVRNAARLGPSVIAEGRYSTPEHVRAAFEAGAYAVCVGTAVTRPDLVLKGLCDEALQAAAARG